MNYLRKTLYIVVVALISPLCMSAQTLPFQQKTLSPRERVNDLVGRMTLNEKIYMLQSDFFYRGCERLGIPCLETADGPLGIASWGLKGRATAFPSQLSLAASWNRDLAYRIGAIYAKEWKARGIQVFYGPGVNIYRSSKDSRNFEYMGEDPYLASEMAVPFIQGIQQNGILATVKHFVANDQEFDRYHVSSEVSERALQEIYYPPFKAAIQRAGVGAIMMGYNLVNGVYCAQNKQLMSDVLRRKWGFQGTIMSDWGATHSTLESVRAGLDMELGTFDYLNQRQLLPLIKSGAIKTSEIDSMVTHILLPCFRLGLFDKPVSRDVSVPTYNDEANQTAYEEACEGIILLKNNEGILPLKSPSSIAVIGPNANPNVVSDNCYDVKGCSYGGGGSSKVNPWYVVTDLEGIKKAFPQAQVSYHEGVSNAYKRRLFSNSVFTTSQGKRGLQACYVSLVDSDKVSTGPHSINQIDKQIDFRWEEGASAVRSLGAAYQVEWKGVIASERNDSILIFVDAQGGYRLDVDGSTVIDKRHSQTFANQWVKIPSQKGRKHTVCLTYWNRNCHPAEIRMGWDYAHAVDYSEALDLARKADCVVFCGGLDASLEFEGTDRSFELPYGQDALIQALVKVNPRTIVAMHGGGAMDMSAWIDKVPALLHMLYPGQEGGTALGQILSGKVNPSAKLPFTMERKWEDSPACGNYDETRMLRKVFYREGIYVGYRGYERKGIKPLFAFGHGLSYTTFAYDNLSLVVTDKKKGMVKVAFDITNTGRQDGAEVVQLYVHDPVAMVDRPYKELKNFAKVFLKAGETRHVEMLLRDDAFKYYHPKRHAWVLEHGKFDILVGASSADMRLRGSIKL